MSPPRGSRGDDPYELTSREYATVTALREAEERREVVAVARDMRILLHAHLPRCGRATCLAFATKRYVSANHPYKRVEVRCDACAPKDADDLPNATRVRLLVKLRRI